MSHIKKVGTELREADLMKSALESFAAQLKGLQSGEGLVQCALNPFDPSLPIRDYYGDERVEKASYLLSRDLFGTYADLGVAYQPDGTFTFIQDDMDGIDMDAITVQYNVALVKREYPDFDVQMVQQANGDVEMVLMERS